MRTLALVLLAACSSASLMGDDQPEPPKSDATPDEPIDYGEACGNGIDDDGDGRVDEDCAPSLFGGVFAPNVSQDPSLAAIEDASGRALAVIQTYRSTTQVDLDRTYLDLTAIFTRGQVPHLNIELAYPKSAYATPSADPLASDLVAMGDSIARALDDHPAGRVFLTFGAEMNGFWTSWGCLAPATFIALYRFAHDTIVAKLDAYGIDHRRVRWVYGPDSRGTNSCGTGPAYYPGHAYVDLLGLSAYRSNTDSVETTVIDPMTALFDGVGIPVEARRDRFVLLQTGSRDVAGRDAWIGELFTKLRNDPRVAGLIYFNATDWAVPTNGAGWTGLTDALRDAPVADAALEGTFAPWFWDVNYSDPAFREIQTLRDHGITSGCQAEPAMFCPDTLIDRRAAATFLTRAFELEGGADSLVGCDAASCDPTPITELELATAIVSLGGGPVAATEEPATRARAAVLIARGARLAPRPL